MGLGKTYSTKYLADSNNNTGVAGQVLSTTSTGIDWADANTLPGAGLWLEIGNNIYNRNTGNVGIGTTSPTAKLQVSGKSFFTNDLFTLQNKGIFFNGLDNFSSGIAGIDSGTSVRIFAGGSEKVRVKSTGNVGIGTTSPQSILHVVSREINNGANKGIRIENYNGTQDYSFRTGVTGVNNSSLAIYDETAGANRIVIESNGEVGIGKTNPSEKLDVNGNVQASTYKIAGTTVLQGTSTVTVGSGGGTGIVQLNTTSGIGLILKGGNVGIGTTSPSQKLEVMGGVVVNSGFNTGIASLYLSHTNPANPQHKAGIFTTYISGYGRSSSMQFALNDQMTGDIVTTADAKMTILENGNVGIGTTSPTSLLEISKQLSAASTIDYPYTISSRDDGNSINQAGGEGVGIKFRIAGNAATTPGDSLVGASIAAIRESSSDSDSSTGLGFFVTQNDETLDEALRIDHDGNVGIGTDSPNFKLEVLGNSRFTDTLNVSASALGAYIYSSQNTGLIVRGGGNAQDIAQFQRVGGSTIAVIDSAGDVGIGTTSPNQKLHVNGATQLGDISATVNFGTVALKVVEGTVSTGPTLGSGAVGAQAVLYSNGQFGMYTGVSTNGDTWMQSQRNDANTATYDILLNPAGGNIGIGTITPSHKLDVAGDIRLQSDNQIYFGATGSIPYWTAGVDNTTNNNFLIGGVSYYTGDRDILLNPAHNGNVGIKNTAPSYTLDVTGNGRYTSTVTATNFILSSDKRLKDNIKEIKTNHIDVSWKNFELKSEPGVKRSGVIAQELEINHPEFVRTDDKGMKSVAYIDLLIAKIAELEARLEKAGI